MRSVIFFVLSALGLLFLNVSLASNDLADREQQRISVKDLVRFAGFGDPNGLYTNQFPRQPGVFSPNNERVAVLVRRGNDDSKTNEATLMVYRTDDLLGKAQPDIVAQFESATSSQPIALIRWLEDNETLVFAGTRGEQQTQVYRLNLKTRQLDELTQGSTPLFWYSITPSGHRLVTLRAWPKRAPGDEPECRQRGCRVVAEHLYNAMFGVPSESYALSLHDLSSGEVKLIASPETVDKTIKRCSSFSLVGEISPDGRFAIWQCDIVEWPVWWGEYTAAAMRADKQWQIKSATRTTALLLVDLERGVMNRISDAPDAPDWPPHLIWIDGGRYFVLPGAFESLTGVSAQERVHRASRMAALLVDPVSHRVVRIAQLDPRVVSVSGAFWDQKAQTLTIRVRDAAGATVPVVSYRRKRGHWVESEMTIPPRGIELVTEQSPNDPPVLVAIDGKSGRKRLLLNPNPWLTERKLGRVEEIGWKAKDGRVWRGGLYYPPDYDSTKRYPLMIQAYGFDSSRFSLNGYTANFAGHALAAQDIVVVDLDTYGVMDLDNTPAVWAAAQAGYEGVIDRLEQLEIINRDRVGIQGFSYSGPQVAYVLTHSSYFFAAGALTSTAVYGWWYYLMTGGGGDAHQDQVFGTSPFGDGLKTWEEYSPSFNLQKVRTPMFMWADKNIAGNWDWYAGLRRLGKPVEYWFLPDGAHSVFKVSERLLTYQLIVDWFRFWLKDEEDADLGKAEQYIRWRALRNQQEHGASRPTINH